jgi:hypothetical protein
MVDGYLPPPDRKMEFFPIIDSLIYSPQHVTSLAVYHLLSGFLSRSATSVRVLYDLTVRMKDAG